MTIHQLGKKQAYYISYRGMWFIFSYNTHIATIKDGVLYKHWHDWSASTMRHLNDILYELGYMWRFNKSEWLELAYTPFDRVVFGCE